MMPKYGIDCVCEAIIITITYTALYKEIMNTTSMAVQVSSVKRPSQENSPAIKEHTFKIQLKALQRDFVTAN